MMLTDEEYEDVSSVNAAILLGQPLGLKEVQPLLRIIDRLTKPAEPARAIADVLQTSPGCKAAWDESTDKTREALLWLYNCFDDEGELRESYQDQLSVALDKADKALASPTTPAVPDAEVVDIEKRHEKADNYWLQRQESETGTQAHQDRATLLRKLRASPATAVTKEALAIWYKTKWAETVTDGFDEAEAFADTFMSSGLLGGVRPVVAEIQAERERQVSQEGWTPEHDDKHCMGEMAIAAGWYSLNAPFVGKGDCIGDPSQGNHEAWGLFWGEDRAMNWPWAMEWWKPKDPRRDLIRAGALIVAEIERLDRAAPPQAKP